MVFRAYHTSANNSLGKFWNGEAYAYGPITEDYKLALQYLNKLYTSYISSRVVGMLRLFSLRTRFFTAIMVEAAP